MTTQTSSIKTGLYVSGLARIAKVFGTQTVSNKLWLTKVKLIWNPPYGGAQTIIAEFCNLSDKQIDLIRKGALLHIQNEELQFNNWQNEDGTWSSYHSIKVWNLAIIMNGKREDQDNLAHEASAKSQAVSNVPDYDENMDF